MLLVNKILIVSFNVFKSFFISIKRFKVAQERSNLHNKYDLLIRYVVFYAYVTLVLRWLRWYFVGISLVMLAFEYLTPYFGYIIFNPHVS